MKKTKAVKISTTTQSAACGCQVGNYYETKEYYLIFCALHAVAKELIDLLKDMRNEGVCKGAWLQFVNEAIDKAEGK